MDIPTQIIKDLMTKGFFIRSSSLVSGGDINQARKLATEDGRLYFLKFNNTTNASHILAAELAGIKLLVQHRLSVPHIVASNTNDTPAYLLMDWIPTSTRNVEKLVRELGALHQITNNQYGLPNNNYIGTLPQKNLWCATFSEFYITCRIEPQLKMALDRGIKLNLPLESFLNSSYKCNFC